MFCTFMNRRSYISKNNYKFFLIYLNNITKPIREAIKSFENVFCPKVPLFLYPIPYLEPPFPISDKKLWIIQHHKCPNQLFRLYFMLDKIKTITRFIYSFNNNRKALIFDPIPLKQGPSLPIWNKTPLLEHFLRLPLHDFYLQLFEAGCLCQKSYSL